MESGQRLDDGNQIRQIQATNTTYTLVLQRRSEAAVIDKFFLNDHLKQIARAISLNFVIWFRSAVSIARVALPIVKSNI